MPAETTHEALLMRCLYCGFPTMLSVLPAWRAALDDHRRRQQADLSVQS